MNTFRSNIIDIYERKGETWLNALPELVTAIASRLDLRDLKEVTNLTYNYVLSGFQGDNPIINPMPELLNYADATTIIHNRITHFAELFELPSQRILDWCFVQTVLAWVWALEDGCDTSYFEQLTKIFDKVDHVRN